MPWELQGNPQTDPDVQFLGTTDSKALVVRTSNKEQLRIDAQGYVGIGLGPGGKPQGTLHVRGSVKVVAIPMAAGETLGVVGRVKITDLPPSHTAPPAVGVPARLEISGTDPGLDLTNAKNQTWRLVTGPEDRPPLVVKTSNVERLRVTADGNVGIATPSPDRRLTIGNEGDATYMNVKDATHEILMGVDGNGGILSVMTNHDLILRAGGNVDRMRLTADGKLHVVHPADGRPTITLDGSAGDILLLNADCAEDFQVADSTSVDAGSVMVINDAGRLEQANRSYDKRVAGVVSGAGDLRPGLVLGREPGTTDTLPIALVGKVYCKVDADLGAIQVGDLLTTSSTPGHAMKASDPAKAFGAVLGKALQPLQEGTGLIPVLVALQ